MPDLSIHLFVEDALQERFVVDGIRWAAQHARKTVEIRPVSTTGGIPALMGELKLFVRNSKDFPDLIVVCIDGNCKGVAQRQREIEGALPPEIRDRTVIAIPDPHVERWFFSDLPAFHRAIGPCGAPPRQKCDKGAYKTLLRRAFEECDARPLLGGAEFVEELYQQMDWRSRTTLDANLGRFFADLNAQGLR